MLLHHAWLAVAVVSLLAAGERIAARLTPEPLARAVTAATLAGTAAVAEALVLGRFGLAGDSLTLGLAAVLTALFVRAYVPAPASGPTWWAGLDARERWALGAAAGALVALVAWLLRHPALGIDGINYHLPEAVSWVQSGHTGSTPVGAVNFQSGSYPLTNEVILAWGMAIGGSFAWIAPWMGLSVALMALAGWTGLRRLGCGRGVTALALAAVLAEPVLVAQLNTPKNDVPALAWLTACAALCAYAAERPALLGPALAAAGLAVGSKTTTLPLAAIVLAAGLWAARGHLRTARWSLILGAVAAVGVGGVWFVRNQIAHGWAFWPFGSGPFGGDAEPAQLHRIHVSFLERPRASLTDGRAGIYARAVGGGIVLVAGGMLAWLMARRRLVVGASVATGIAAIAWAAAPYTGRADNPVLDLSLTTVRYLLPVFAAGAAALALAGRTSRVARLVLAAALVWNLNRSARYGFPDVPSVWTMLVGAAVGAAAAFVAGRRLLRAVVVLGIAAAAIFAARSADGWLRHSADTSATATAPVQAFFAKQPGWARSRDPVAFWPVMAGPVAGDRLRHPLAMIGERATCAQIRALARRGWVVVRDLPPSIDALLGPSNVPACIRAMQPVARAGDWLLYRQTATTSSAAPRSSDSRRKSSTAIAASSGVSRRRNSVSIRS